MTANRDLVRQLDGWLDEAAVTSIPDRLLDRSLARVERTRQRPAWLVRNPWAGPGRGPVVPARWWLGPALVAGAAAILIAVASLSPHESLPSVGVQPSPTATSTPSLSPSPGHSSTPTPYPCGQGPDSCRGVLQAGAFASRQFQPGFRLNVSAGWINDLDVHSMVVLLDPAGGSTTYPDGTMFRDGIYVFRGPVAASATADEPVKGVGHAAHDLARWLNGLDGVDASGLETVTLNGVHGSRLDIGLPEGPRAPRDRCADHGNSRCASLFMSSTTGATPGGPDWFQFGIVGPETAVVYLLDAPSGETVMVVIDDVDGVEREALVSAATPIVNSLDLTP